MATTNTPNITLSSTPITQNESCYLEDDSLSVSLAVLYSLIFLFGLAGNTLALWVFIVLHSRRNSIRIFLINVALADLVLIACLPFRILYHASGDHWPLGEITCRVVGNLFYMNMYVSIMLLGLISLDRYLKIQGTRGSSRHRWLRGNRWSIVACGVLWAMSLLSVVPMIVRSEGNEEKGRCFQFKQRTQVTSKVYFNALLVGVFWIVFLLLLLTYGQIAFRLLKESHDRPDLPNAGRYTRAAKKSFVVLLLFTVCFVPYHAFRGVYLHAQLNKTSCQTQRTVGRANEIMLLFSAFNSCLDPIMYFVLSSSVRKATIKAVSRALRMDHNSTANNSSTTELRRTSMSQASTAVLATPRGSVAVINSSSMHLKNSPGHTLTDNEMHHVEKRT